MLALLARAFRGNRELSTFVVCVVISFAFMALAPAAKDVLSGVLGTPLRPFKGLRATRVRIKDVEEDIAALRALTVRLTDEKRALVQYKHENDRLRELMEFLVSFPEEEHLELVPARVVGLPGVRAIETIEIAAGTNDSIGVDMAVVVPEGLVGKVVRVQKNLAYVEPVGTAASEVSVTIERSRVRGVVRARYGGPSGLLSRWIDYVPARKDVRLGDLVVTSGLGGVYPPGLAVGRVSSITEGPVTMSVGIELAVDFSTIEQVFVVTRTRATAPGLSHDEQRLLDEIKRAREAGEID